MRDFTALNDALRQRAQETQSPMPQYARYAIYNAIDGYAAHRYTEEAVLRLLDESPTMTPRNIKDVVQNFPGAHAFEVVDIYNNARATTTGQDAPNVPSAPVYLGSFLDFVKTALVYKELRPKIRQNAPGIRDHALYGETEDRLFATNEGRELLKKAVRVATLHPEVTKNPDGDFLLEVERLPTEHTGYGVISGLLSVLERTTRLSYRPLYAKVETYRKLITKLRSVDDVDYENIAAVAVDFNLEDPSIDRGRNTCSISDYLIWSADPVVLEKALRTQSAKDMLFWVTSTRTHRSSFLPYRVRKDTVAKRFAELAHRLECQGTSPTVNFVETANDLIGVVDYFETNRLPYAAACQPRWCDVVFACNALLDAGYDSAKLVETRTDRQTLFESLFPTFTGSIGELYTTVVALAND